MTIEVLRIDLVARRRAVIGYTLGMALYALVIVAIYPEFEHSTSLNNLTKNTPTLAALFGAIGSLTSPSGWLNVSS
jgi:beta-exotoxin I transport system permease protein